MFGMVMPAIRKDVMAQTERQGVTSDQTGPVVEDGRDPVPSAGSHPDTTDEPWAHPAIRVLESLDDEDPEEQRRAWEWMRDALNEGRPEGYKIYP